MKFKASRLFIGTLACALSAHAQTKNVSVRGLYQIETFDSSKALKTVTADKERPWEKSIYANQNKEVGLQTIYTKTSNFLKSPNRVQKAGGLDGGGGNSLICEENGRYSAKLLDVHEAEQLGIKLDFGPALNFEDKIDYVLNRLSQVSPIRAATYKAMAADLLKNNTQWINNTAMPVIEDVKLVLIPQGCLLVQTAIQRPIDQANLPNAKTFIIDQDMFSLLDEESKAALILHEVMYREARYSGDSDSTFTRSLFGVIASSQILKMTTQSLNELLYKNGIMCMERSDLPYLDQLHLPDSRGACGYKENFQIKTSGLIDLSVPQDFSYHQNLRLKYSGVLGKSTATVEGKQYLERSVEFEGALKNEAHNLTIKIKNGKLISVNALKIPADIDASGLMDSFKFFSRYVESLKSLQLQANLSEKLDVTSSIFVATGENIEIESPYVKLNCQEKCNEKFSGLLIFGDSLYQSVKENFQVYIGANQGVETQNGWFNTRAVQFNEKKVTRVALPLEKGATKDVITWLDVK